MASSEIKWRGYWLMPYDEIEMLRLIQGAGWALARALANVSQMRESDDILSDS